MRPWNLSSSVLAVPHALDLAFNWSQRFQHPLNEAIHRQERTGNYYRGLNKYQYYFGGFLIIVTV